MNSAADSARLQAIQEALETIASSGLPDVDIAAIIAGIAGAVGASKTLKDVDTSIAAVTAKLSADPATQTTLAAILAKIIAAPATETSSAAILAKLSADPATQTTLAAVLAKLSADPATQTTLAAIKAKTDNIPAQGSALMADSIPVTLAPDGLMVSIAKGAGTAGSGQLLTCTAAATDYSATVVALATYRVTAVNGIIYLGVADVQAADSAVLWIIPAGDTQIITIPSGTALHFRSDAAGVLGRLSRIQ